MSNPNYLKGRRFEYKVVKDWSTGPFQAVRTAGSHSPYDVIAFTPDVVDNLDLITHAKPTSHEEHRGGYAYIRYVYPLLAYGIQCKVRKLKKKGGKR